MEQIQADSSSIKVRNAIQAIDTALTLLRKQKIPKVPDKNTKWQEKAIYSTEPQDYAITRRLFTSDNWSIEVYQGVAPLSSTIYQVTIFSEKFDCYWKGNVKADGSIEEVIAFKLLSEEENRDIAEDFLRKSRIPPHRPGGYGH